MLRDTLQLVLARVFEDEIGACDEIPSGAGDKDLRRSGEGTYPTADVHRDSPDLAVERGEEPVAGCVDPVSREG